MGNNTCGFGVVNNTEFDLTVCLSMGATHYYENDIRPGEVFYRWPGAVWYTVSVYPSELGGRMTGKQQGKEIALAIGIGLGAGAAAAGAAIVFAGTAVVGGGAAAVAGAAGVAGAAEAATVATGVTTLSVLGVEVAAVSVAVSSEIVGVGAAGAVAATATSALVIEGAATTAVGAAAGAAAAVAIEEVNNKIAKPTLDLISKAFACVKVNSPVSIQESFKNAGWEVSIEAASSFCKSSKIEAIMIYAMHVIQKSKMVHVTRGHYGGGVGTWLKVCGLPFAASNDGVEYRLASTDIEQKDLEPFRGAEKKCLDHGFKFTDISYKEFYGKEKSGKENIRDVD